MKYQDRKQIADQNLTEINNIEDGSFFCKGCITNINGQKECVDDDECWFLIKKRQRQEFKGKCNG